MTVTEQSVRAAKQALRKEIRARLKALSEEALQEQASATVHRVLTLPAYLKARAVSVYLTMPTGELRTEAIVRHALEHGKTVYIPFTKTNEPNVMKMLHLRSCAEFEGLKPNNWKIPEHHEHEVEGLKEALDPDSEGLDLILLPGLGFDKSRTRLGHGKGYYDRYLAATEAWCHAKGRPMPATVGLALEEQILDMPLPFDATDRKPDLVVHPKGILGQKQ